ncbi:MAG: hypothetical protein Q4C20_01100 [Erysipelotrichaceae bacterium]|nr:hypothetical protein [Erysipelotrichaceae bacterium]
MNHSGNISLFDFIALLLSDLKENSTRYAGLQVKSRGIHCEYQKFIDDLIDEVKDNYRQNDKDLLQNIVTDGIPPDIFNQYVTNEEFRKNTDAVYQLASDAAKSFLSPDNLLKASQEAYKLANNKDHTTGFKQLNSDQSVKETGYILLPDLGTFGNKMSKSTTRYEKIWLKNLIILTPDDLVTKDKTLFEVRNVIADKHSHLQQTTDNATLTFALSPICDRWLLKDSPVIYENEFGTKEYRFQIDGLTDEDFITRRVKSAYRTACEYKPHLLMFPEMYGTENLSRHADEIIRNASDGDGPLIIMPSWWHDQTNEAPVMDDSLTPLCSQSKHSPFLYMVGEPGELEDLEHHENLVYLFHYPDIGRICVCICKDFLMDSYRRMLCESLEASIILVPAFTPEIDSFKNCMDGLKQSGTYGLFINCCAARANPGGVYTPINSKCIVGEVSLTRSAGTKYGSPYRLLKPQCNGVCGGPDTCCVFIVTITSSGRIKVKHIHK